MASSREHRGIVLVIFGPPVVRAFPVILPALSDELLSSWLRRHAAFYGVGEGQILRHCLLDVPTFRHLDLGLAVRDQHRLGNVLRCGALAIRRMTQSRNGKLPMGPVATVQTDAGLQAVRWAPRCDRSHSRRPVAKLDGALAHLVPSVRSAAG